MEQTHFVIETLTEHHGWTDDAELLGPGLHQSDNSWPTREAAMQAVAQLCHPLVGFDYRRLRVMEVASIPTVDGVLAAHAICNGFYFWDVEGGRVQLSKSELRPALELAYDESDPQWPMFVALD